MFNRERRPASPSGASRQSDMGQKNSKAPQVETRYLAPQKLYCYSEVDLRKLRKLIKDRKLAPCFPGVDSESREVVILFLLRLSAGSM